MRDETINSLNKLYSLAGELKNRFNLIGIGASIKSQIGEHWTILSLEKDLPDGYDYDNSGSVGAVFENEEICNTFAIFLLDYIGIKGRTTGAQKNSVPTDPNDSSGNYYVALLPDDLDRLEEYFQTVVNPQPSAPVIDEKEDLRLRSLYGESPSAGDPSMMPSSSSNFSNSFSDNRKDSSAFPFKIAPEEILDGIQQKKEEEKEKMKNLMQKINDKKHPSFEYISIGFSIYNPFSKNHQFLLDYKLPVDFNYDPGICVVFKNGAACNQFGLFLLEMGIQGKTTKGQKANVPVDLEDPKNPDKNHYVALSPEDIAKIEEALPMLSESSPKTEEGAPILRASSPNWFFKLFLPRSPDNSSQLPPGNQKNPNSL